MWKKKSVCKYTPEGRREIHKNLGMDTRTMLFLMRTKEVGRSVEYMDNRISLYVAQYGKCAITGKILELHEIHCHHKKPVSQGGNDRYENLTILHKDIHRIATRNKRRNNQGLPLTTTAHLQTKGKAKQATPTGKYASHLILKRVSLLLENCKFTLVNTES